MKLTEVYQLIQRKMYNTHKYYDKHGLWKTILAIFEHTGVFKYRVLIFFELKVEDPISGQKAGKSIELVRLAKDDIEQIDEYCDGWFKKDEALRRLEQGRVLFVVKEDEKMAFYQWLEFTKVDIPYIDLSFSIPDDTAYMAYIYTVPDYRGKGIASNAKPLVLNYLREQGYRRILLVITPENAASQRVNKKAGFKEYQTIFYLKLLFLKYYRVKDYGTNRKKRFWHITGTDQELWKTFSKLGHG